MHFQLMMALLGNNSIISQEMLFIYVLLWVYLHLLLYV